MSVWSLTCQQSVFKRYHSDKHLWEFYLQDGGKNQLAWIWNEITSLTPCVLSTVAHLAAWAHAGLCLAFLVCFAARVYSRKHKASVWCLSVSASVCLRRLFFYCQCKALAICSASVSFLSFILFLGSRSIGMNYLPGKFHTLFLQPV